MFLLFIRTFMFCNVGNTHAGWCPASGGRAQRRPVLGCDSGRLAVSAQPAARRARTTTRTGRGDRRTEATGSGCWCHSPGFASSTLSDGFGTRFWSAKTKNYVLFIAPVNNLNLIYFGNFCTEGFLPVADLRGGATFQHKSAKILQLDISTPQGQACKVWFWQWIHTWIGDPHFFCSEDC